MVKILYLNKSFIYISEIITWLILYVKTYTLFDWREFLQELKLNPTIHKNVKPQRIIGRCTL